MTSHSCTFHATQRDEHGHATQWVGECQCGEDFTGPDYPAVSAMFDEHRETVGRRKRTHIVRLTSHDHSSECQFEVTDYGLRVLKDLAKAVNSSAKWAIDVRMFLDPKTSADTGEAA